MEPLYAVTDYYHLFFSALIRLLQECAESETCSNKFLELNMKVNTFLSNNICRVATVREKVLENEKCSRSGNFINRQGNLEKMKKVMEKSGNFKNFKKIAS